MNYSVFHRIRFVLLGLLFLTNAVAQTNLQHDNTPVYPAAVGGAKAATQSTPATHSGSAAASLFTGRLSYTIPIYTIEDIDFHLDIALRYSTEGFKPFQPSGSYGQDWTLVAGGCITRSVQGLADEHRIIYTGGSMEGYQQIGMLQAIKEGENPVKEEVFDFTTPLHKPECGIQYSEDDYYIPSGDQFKASCDWDRDYMSDIFYFSFCGYKGSFTINNAGKPVITSGDFVDINFGSFNEMDDDNRSQNSLYTPSDASSIIIRTMDGYSYTFGGSHNAMEYSSYVKKDEQVNQPVPAVSAWHLTKITAPNGRSLMFSYVNSSGTDMLNAGLMSFITDYDWTEQSTDSIIYMLHKDCLLQSISTSDSIPLTVTFHSHPEAARQYEVKDDFRYSKPHMQLDSIIVEHAGRKIRKARFSYQYRSYLMDVLWLSPKPNYNWRYLKEVYISGIGKYTMMYDHFDPYPSNPLPNMNVYHLHWYPNLYPQTSAAYKKLVDRFGFWKVSDKQGLLRTVSLPTGGKIKFTYGSHQYGEERRFRSVGTEDVELYSLTDTAKTIGGVRIEKIETFADDSTLVETKTFSYNKQNAATSSGVFYNIYEIFYATDPTTGHAIANPFNYGMIDSHIGYSYVQQTITSGTRTYKTAYTFDTGYNSYSSLGNSLINRSDSVPNYSSTTELCSGSLTYNGLLRIPGNILAIDQYRTNTLIKSTRYKYNGIPNNMEGVTIMPDYSLGNTDTIVCLSKYSAHVARKLIVRPPLLEQVATYEYGSDGAPMISAKAYTYDSLFRKKKELTTDSRGVLRFTKYTYPDDIPGANYPGTNPPALFIMIHSNRIGTPVETIYGYSQNDVEYITAGNINLYANNTDTIGNGVYFYPYLYKTLALSLTKPTPNYQHMTVSNTQPVYDDNYRLECQYYFNKQNRLLSVRPFGKTATTYTWDGLYPVTRTIGNQTTRYTYIPYVGVSSVTDPRGVTTYYTYDADGRLTETYQLENGKKQILNIYQYHIKTE